MRLKISVGCGLLKDMPRSSAVSFLSMRQSSITREKTLPFLPGQVHKLRLKTQKKV